MGTIEVILKQCGIYIVTCVITICVVYCLYKTCLKSDRPRPTIEEIRISFNRRNRELMVHELSIIQEQLDITNTLKNYLEQIKHSEGVKDDIAIIIGPDGDLHLGTKIKN